MLKMTVFAAFAVVRDGDHIWATTRPSGGIGLPGGKVDMGESPCQCALRESAEEGLHLLGSGTLIHEAIVDGAVVQWFAFDGATPLDTWKEQHRGIKPVLVPVIDIANSGFGNEFLMP